MSLKITRQTISPHDEELERMIQVFRALADDSRLRILILLDSERKYSVTEIAEMLNLTQSNVSHHLSKLGDMGFVAYRRLGKKVYYYLKDECVRKIMRSAYEHVR